MTFEPEEHTKLIATKVRSRANDVIEDIKETYETEGEEAAYKKINDLMEDLADGSVAFAVVTKLLYDWEKNGDIDFIGQKNLERFVNDCSYVMSVHDKMTATLDRIVGGTGHVRR